MKYILLALALALGACSTNYQAELVQAQKNIEGQIGCSLGSMPSLMEDSSWVGTSAVNAGKVLTVQNGKIVYSVWFKGLSERERFAALQKGIVALNAPHYMQMVPDAEFVLSYPAAVALKARCS